MSFKDAASDLQTETDLKAQLTDALARLRLYERIPKTVSSLKIPEYKSGKGSAVAVALLSDIHVEERIDPADLPGGYNEYNPEICKKRIEQYAQRVVLLTQAQRHLTDIKTLVLGILGDVISGYIHDDLRESNWLSPTQAILFGLELLTGVIKHLLEYGGFDKLVIVCTPGNHGRLTQKPRAKTAIETNLEWMLYQLLQGKFEGDPRIDWHIAGGAHVYLDINGKVCRFHHGDDIQYQGGVGGLTIPLMKALAAWNRMRVADYDFLGHWHSCKDLSVAVTNGSVCGYGAYALKAKCMYEPPKQAYVLIDSRRGKSLFADIWCDYLPKTK